jgi:hypothetical protein
MIPEQVGVAHIGPVAQKETRDSWRGAFSFLIRLSGGCEQGDTMTKKPKKPRKEPAERVLIIDEWDKWVRGKIPEGEKGTDMQGLEFHGYLGREKPLLLEFKYAGNRWQQVKVWLREAERISR